MFDFPFYVDNLQGKLYTAITIPLYHYFLSTRFELLTMNYKIYITKDTFDKYFDDFTFHDQFYFVNNTSQCIEKVKQEPKYDSICAGVWVLVKYSTSESNKIHVVKDYSLRKYYRTYITRDNFSLFKRLSKIFRYLNEAGLIAYSINYQNYFGYKNHRKILNWVFH